MIFVQLLFNFIAVLEILLLF